MLSLLLVMTLAQQGPLTQGNFLKNPAYQTGTTAISLFVDPTGSDSNPCTASGTAACLTIGGAAAKFPRFLNSSTITINVAAGTYSETLGNNFNQMLEGNFILSGPALTNFTVATGTATGTVTAFTNTGLDPPTFTDGAQTWTVNDLRGTFLVMTNGTANAQVRPITGNTATVLTLAGGWQTAPTVGNSYAIQIPAAIITSSSASATFVGSLGRTAPRTRIFQILRMDINNTGVGGAACGFGGDANTSLVTSRCQATASSSTAVNINGGTNLSLNGSILKGVAYGVRALGLTSTSTVVPEPRANPTLSLTNSFLYGTSGPGLSVWGPIQVQNSSASAVATMYTIQTAAASQNALEVLSASASVPTTSSTNVTTSIIRCESATGTVGLVMPSNGGGANVATQPPTFYGGTLYIDGCATGVNIDTGYVWVGKGLNCNNNTTCATVSNGAKLHIPNPWTLTGVTNPLTIDGVNFTAASLTGASPARITNVATLSTVWYQ